MASARTIFMIGVIQKIGAGICLAIVPLRPAMWIAVAIVLTFPMAPLAQEGLV